MSPSNSDTKILFEQKFKKSFIPKSYKNLAFQSLKESFKYLLFLFLILSLIFTLKGFLVFSFFVRKWPEVLEEIKQINLPEITIKEGEIILPQEKFLFKKEKFVFIIDPKKEIEYYLDFLKNYQGGIVLLNENLIFKAQQKIEIYNLSGIKFLNLKFFEGKNPLILTFDNQTFKLSYSRINNWLRFLLILIFPIIFLFLFSYYWIAKLLQILIFSLLSLILNKIKKLNLKYSNLLNVGIFALTPPLIFESLIKLIEIRISYFGLIYVLVYLIFLNLGLLNLKNAASPNQQRND